MKTPLILGLVLLLAGCGGYHKAKRETGRVSSPRTISAPVAITPNAQAIITSSENATQVTYSLPQAKPFANGPIQRACMNSDRKARSRELCGCIQAVADQTLSGGEQSRAVSFYRDPHSAQETRQSDLPADEAFWKTYTNYANTAQRICR